MLYFEDIEIGSLRTSGPYLVSRDEIVEFAKKYDPQDRHVDEDAAAHSVAGGLTAAGSHTFAIYTALTRRFQPPVHTLAALGWDELRLPNPVRPGDELDLTSTVLEKRESNSNPTRGIVRFQIRLRNQKRETALQCISNILVAKRPAAN
jgi:acyl dehydratase